MRSVIISSIILTVSMFLLILNIVFVSSTTNKLLVELDALPDYIPESQYEEYLGSIKLDYIINYYNKNEFFLSLTTNMQEIQAVKASLLSMREYYKNGSQAHYLASRAVFGMYIERWHKNELPHADNIF